MAKFVCARSPGGNTSYWINVDSVNYVQQAQNDRNKCTIKFGDDRSITIEMSAEDFTAQIGGVSS